MACKFAYSMEVIAGNFLYIDMYMQVQVGCMPAR